MLGSSDTRCAFLTFPSAQYADDILRHFEENQKTTLMPGSERTFMRSYFSG